MMRGSLAGRLHRAENAFDSLKKRALTDAYEEHLPHPAHGKG